MTTISDLTAAVAAQNTVEQSLLTLINGLVSQLSAAKAAGDSAGMDTLLSSIQSNTKLLSDAVVANTPAAPAPVVVSQPAPASAPTPATSVAP